MTPTTASEALSMGLAHYFSGTPCKRGHIDKRMASNRRCLSCNREDQRQHYAANGEKVRARHQSNGSSHRATVKKYGITPEQYAQMFADQGGACAVCRKPQDKKLSVDHCHTTGAVRGLLCTNCNVGIGYFQDKPGLLEEAIRYLVSSGASRI